MSGGDGRPVLREPTVYLLMATAMMAPFDVNVIGPALPTIRAAFGLSDAQTGLVITVFALPGIVTAPVIGMLADRYGRRSVIIPCLMVYGGAGLAVLIVEEFLLVLVLRFVQGTFGGSILASLALTVVGDVYDGTVQNTVMGMTSASITVTAALAPAIGGALAAIAWDAPFATYGLSVVVAGAVYLWLDEPVSGMGGGQANFAYLKTAVEAVPSRTALGLYAANFASFTFFFGGVLTGISFLLSNTYSLGSGRIGALITGAMLVSAIVALLNGRFVRYVTEQQLIGIGFLFYGVGLIGTWAAGSVSVVFGGLVLFGVGHGFVLPSVAAALAALAPTRYRGGVMSIRTSLVLASQAVGPPLFTIPAGVFGYQPLMLIAGGLAAAGGMGALVLLAGLSSRG